MAKIVKNTPPRREYAHTWRFYLYAYNVMSKIVFGFWFVILCMVFLAAARIIVGFDPEQIYSVGPKGQLMDIVTLDGPRTSDVSAYAFLNDAITESFTLYQSDLDKRLKRINAYYDQKGSSEYRSIIEKSNILSAIKAGSILTSDIVSQAELVLDESKVYDGVKVWTFVIQVRHIVQSGGSNPQAFVSKYRVRIKQAPYETHGLGLAVYSINVI